MKMSWQEEKNVCYSLSDIFMLIFFIFLCLMVGVISSAFMKDSLTVWYSALVHSPLSPPNELFAPVWTFLYTIMGIAFWQVWKRRTSPFFPQAVLLFFVGLFLNGIWTFFFFYLENPLLGLVNILGLDFAVILTTYFFFKISRFAGILFLPYVAWLLFATYLNAYIVWAN